MRIVLLNMECVIKKFIRKIETNDLQINDVENVISLFLSKEKRIIFSPGHRWMYYTLSLIKTLSTIEIKNNIRQEY